VAESSAHRCARTHALFASKSCSVALRERNRFIGSEIQVEEQECTSTYREQVMNLL